MGRRRPGFPRVTPTGVAMQQAAWRDLRVGSGLGWGGLIIVEAAEELLHMDSAIEPRRVGSRLW